MTKVILCKDCMFWESYPCNERGLGCCKRMSEGPPAEGEHIAYAEADVSFIGASLTCAPTFGCVLAMPKASDTKANVDETQPYNRHQFISMGSGPVSSIVCGICGVFERDKLRHY